MRLLVAMAVLLLALAGRHAFAQAASAPPKNEQLYAQMTALMEENDYTSLADVMGGFQDVRDAFTALEWSKDQLMAGRGSYAVISAHYSQLLKSFAKYPERWIWFAFSYLTLNADAARCADPGGRDARLKSLAHFYGSLMQEFRSVRQVERHRIVIDARRLEAMMLSRRPPDRWLCAAGMNYLMKYLEKHGDRGAKKIQTPDDVHPVRIVPLDPELVQLLPDAEWSLRREEALERATDYLMK